MSIDVRKGYILTGPLAEGVKQIAEAVAADSPGTGGPVTIAGATDKTTIDLPSVNAPLAAILASLQAQILSIPSGGAGSNAVSTTFNTAVKYDINYRYYPGINVINSNTVMTRNEAGAITFGETTFDVQMNGVNTLDVTALGTKVGAQVLDNTNGQRYTITTWKSAGGDFFYGVQLGQLVDVSKPSVLNMVVSDTNALEILVTWSKVISSTISAPAAFGVTGHTISAHTYVDTTHTKFTLTTPFVQGETPRTGSYVVPGSNPMKDTAGSPNFADPFSGFAITNNVTTPAVILSVADATPARVDFTFSEAMDTGAGSTPAAVDFAMSVGALSGFTWDDSTHAHAASSHTFVNGETITQNYTAGTNKFKDAAGGNLLANYSAKAITNNVLGSSGILSYTNITMPASINLDDAGILDWLVPMGGAGGQNWCKFISGSQIITDTRTGTLGGDNVHSGSGLTQTSSPAAPTLGLANPCYDLGGFSSHPASDINGTHPIALHYDNGGSTPSWYFTVPADTTTRTVDIIWGSGRVDAYSIAGSGNIHASLSDTSASDISVSVTAPAADAGSNLLRTRITFKAATAGQTLSFGFMPTYFGALPEVALVLLGHE